MKILFVCTGNVFRSLSAERILKELEPRWEVKSAGIYAMPEPVHPSVKSCLKELGIDVSDHQQTRIEKEHVEWADIVVAMTVNHMKFIEYYFDIEPVLFLELAQGKQESLWDVDDILSPDEISPDNIDKVIRKTILKIYELMPAVRDALTRNA